MRGRKFQSLHTKADEFVEHQLDVISEQLIRLDELME